MKRFIIATIILSFMLIYIPGITCPEEDVLSSDRVADGLKPNSGDK